MTEVLICTTVERMGHVQHILLPSLPDVCYLVSCQGGEPSRNQMAGLLRPDVRVVWMQERGLSKNRNHAFAHAVGDVLVMADDDNELVPETLMDAAADFKLHPQWGIIQYRMAGSGKPFPAPYVSSCELVMRREVARQVPFDERFGIGSPHLACGEEEVFVWKVREEGFEVGQIDKPLCRVDGTTTGERFLSDARVQRSKGAVFALTRGRWRAYIKCTREALGWMLRKGANPIPLIKNMFWGIRYALSVQS